MIKPLPSCFQLLGFGQLNLGAFLQAGVSSQASPAPLRLLEGTSSAPTLKRSHAAGLARTGPVRRLAHGFATASHLQTGGVKSQRLRQSLVHICYSLARQLMQVAVRNIIFSGTLHIILSPLLNSLPVVGAIQVSYSSATACMEIRQYCTIEDDSTSALEFI